MDNKMSARKLLSLMLIFTYCLAHSNAYSAMTADTSSLATADIANQLGWINSGENSCGGYYLEGPFIYPADADKPNAIEITGNQGLYRGSGTSELESLTIRHQGQQLTANQGFLYREAETGKLSIIDLIGNVHLQEPNTLVIAKEGRYHLVTKTKSLHDILYRTTLNGHEVAGPKVTSEEKQHDRKITTLSAFGSANEFSQTEPRVYEFDKTTFSTCPPTDPVWQVKAGHIVLDKNTGRGYATDARIVVKNIPIFYFPYINFSIDRQRKSGFLWPVIGHSKKWGGYLQTPFYWNMAPNDDMTITPGYLSLRGFQFVDYLRYLTHKGSGTMKFDVLPNDRAFRDFQAKAPGNINNYVNITGNTTEIIQAELNRLENASPTRNSFIWRDDSQFNSNWSTYIDLNHASDDYYMEDFGNLREITENQLLQEGDLYFKSEHWNSTLRLQSYQALHPIDRPPVTNQYRRLPQLILNGDYPDQFFGLDYFINNEITHFGLLKTPGASVNQPVGNRLNLQPGLSLPLNWPFFFINPRFQLAMTQYQLTQTQPTNTPGSKRRTLPIFDIASGLALSRDMTWFHHPFRQTLEPQAYYTYIPYRNQASIPLFDTTVNTLSYDQIFNYNRFSGIDRIGDANQIGVGMTTRLIDQRSGLEKVRLGVGDILYFSNRRVTMCNNTSCTDNPFNPENKRRLSPVSGVIDYHVRNDWRISTNALWNPVSKQIDNATAGIHYQTDDTHIINLGYNYARNGNPFSCISTNNSQNNLKVTDISFSLPAPFIRDLNLVGRLSHDWASNHFH